MFLCRRSTDGGSRLSGKAEQASSLGADSVKEKHYENHTYNRMVLLVKYSCLLLGVSSSDLHVMLLTSFNLYTPCTYALCSNFNVEKRIKIFRVISVQKLISMKYFQKKFKGTKKVKYSCSIL